MLKAILDVLRGILQLLKDILAFLKGGFGPGQTGPLVTLEVTAVKEIPRKRGDIIMIDTGNHFWDLVELEMDVQPNGALDAPPTWTVDVTDPNLILTPAVDGLSATLLSNIDIAAFTVTVTAPADNPSTPDLESVSQSFTGSFSHSKATSLGGTFSELPKPA